jgi:hypothetical protein
LIGDQALEPGVLLLEGRQPLRITHDHVAVPLLPDVQGTGREAVTTAQVWTCPDLVDAYVVRTYAAACNCSCTCASYAAGLT